MKLSSISSERGLFFTVHSLGSILTNCPWDYEGKHYPTDCPYQDSTQDIRSNITLYLQEFPRVCPLRTPSGKGYIWPYMPRLVLIRIQYNILYPVLSVLYTVHYNILNTTVNSNVNCTLNLYRSLFTFHPSTLFSHRKPLSVIEYHHG